MAELVGSPDKTVGERQAFYPGHAQVMLDEGGRLGQVKGLEVVADMDALVEGLELLELEALSEVGLAEEDEGEGGIGIHVGVEPEAELVEEAAAEEVRLVDDENRTAAALGQVGEGVAQSFAQSAGVVSGPDAEDTATLLADGRVVTAGGSVPGGVLAAAEMYGSAVNHAPVAADDAYHSVRDTVLSVPQPGVLANDTDADGDPLSAILDTPPGSGTLDLNPDGSFILTPAPSFVGVVTFTYHASDGMADSQPATVTLTVKPIFVYLPLVVQGLP